MKRCAAYVMTAACLLLRWVGMPTAALAQRQTLPDETAAEQVIEDICSLLADEGQTAAELDEWRERLAELAQNPINLNTATREQLEQLYFLTERQADDILYYIGQYGPMYSCSELQLIGSLRPYEVRNMLPFVYAGAGGERERPFYLREALRNAHHELIVRADHAAETKEGYRYDPDADAEEVAPPYAGNPFYASVRYRLRVQDRIRLSLTAEKDAGEAFTWRHGGFDFYSASLELSNFGCLKRVVLGDYRVSFGQGLVVNPAFRMSRSADVTNVACRTEGLRRYASTPEAGFMRGVGATMQWGRWQATAFYSYRHVDGKVEDGVFHTIQTTGLHRTESELAARHAVGQQVGGVHVMWQGTRMEIGLTAVHTQLSDTLRPQPTAYNANFFAGTQQTTAGVHYRMRAGRVNLFGETAVTDQWAWATLNGMSLTPVAPLTLLVMQRHYGIRFDNMHASAFGQSGRNTAESGLYVAARIDAPGRWTFRCAADAYRYAYPHYNADTPTDGLYALLQAETTTQQGLMLNWRIRYDRRGTNVSNAFEPIGQTRMLHKGSLRFQIRPHTALFSTLTTAEVNFAHLTGNRTSGGGYTSQDIGFQQDRIGLSAWLRFQFFDAAGYHNRIYSYEQDLPGAFSIPTFFGQGVRLALRIAYRPTAWLQLWFKAGQTIYADRDEVGSGTEAIRGPKRTDFRIQARLTL
ncbi:MAG: helix-hairpin-helix domain-containing protein [Paludibacteraceae bacterium]|nr:helix-hairpin-helix domain-containing protein [Paludibacteraceae bacterium]